MIVARFIHVVLGLAFIVPVPSQGAANSSGAQPQPMPGSGSHNVELSDALELALHRQPRASIVDAALKRHDGRDAWDVEMTREGKRVHVWVDAGDGTVKIQVRAAN